MSPFRAAIPSFQPLRSLFHPPVDCRDRPFCLQWKRTICSSLPSLPGLGFHIRSENLQISSCCSTCFRSKALSKSEQDGLKPLPSCFGILDPSQPFLRAIQGLAIQRKKIGLADLPAGDDPSL